MKIINNQNSLKESRNKNKYVTTQFESQENHGNPRIPREIHEIHENHKNACENN